MHKMQGTIFQTCLRFSLNMRISEQNISGSMNSINKGFNMFYTTTYDVSFYHTVNGTSCKVDARAHGDECDGVCKVEILAVWFEGVNVAELIDDATLGDIESRIDDECAADWANR